MREIIFRAWDGKKLSIGKAEYFDDSVNFRFEHFDIDCDKPILEQYTGLKDRNGVMIFEGDNFLVQTWEDDGRESLAYFTVCWDSKGLCWMAKSHADSMYDEKLADVIDDSLEIIGNIHDQKEDV